MQSPEEILQQRLQKRFSEIAAALSQVEDSVNTFDTIVETQEVLRGKLSAEDGALVDQLEQSYGELIAMIEQAFYLGGWQDGGRAHVAS